MGIDGVIGTYGFSNIIGGVGNESGVAAVQADDEGFVCLATMENSNGVNIMMLVKVNNEGELIN